ncbi:SidA/IucD/PvdA family monooxygenase [Streptacidiphilus sp. PB12-B1b]|uniref:lysine N(6)-hydroxylase/L-ornithine N(5)-oxygenase family protein n=1 Tax=Streptacidiphilus sp. PB12-B1b TaxID=2705012 RepID=UPI0015FB887A|nr:SidA/IucD/PvdA family monooxygenase [Streptacidiphilus sp. PB12-B1b]QMU78738.1 SidA/IucD/PvdA family monooxygenase [Streptacidiphilus sp. PB12-B1b]
MPEPTPAAPRTPAAPGPADAPAPYDLVGVGLGPFNLSLAALADGVPGLRSLFLEAKPQFSWHPGLLLDGARMQVPFLADLVSLVDPTSRWSFLAYLRAHDRLFPFYFSEQSHLSRREYEHYCRWVSQQLPHCRFGSPVQAVSWDGRAGVFRVALPDGARVAARNLVLGVGTEPVVPPALRELHRSGLVHHAEEYLHVRHALSSAADISVLGSGQSGAEVFLDLLRTRGDLPEQHLRWITRTPAIAPMEYSKLGLEHFTPDYTRYFHALPQDVRDRLVPEQWQLYKAASAETLAEIHAALYERTTGGAPADAEILPGTEVRGARAGADGGLELHCRHRQTGAAHTVRTDALVLATGYAARRPALLDPLADLVDWDDQGRYRVGLDHRVGLRPDVTAGLYVQNAELHTHGVGTPDLGLGAHRAAVILNAVAGRTVHRLPGRTAWTTFGPPRHRTPGRPGTARPGPELVPQAPLR